MDKKKKKPTKLKFTVGGNAPLSSKVREHLEAVGRDEEERLRKTSKIRFIG